MDGDPFARLQSRLVDNGAKRRREAAAKARGRCILDRVRQGNKIGIREVEADILGE